jgi:hypothetical protein
MVSYPAYNHRVSRENLISLSYDVRQRGVKGQEAQQGQSLSGKMHLLEGYLHIAYRHGYRDLSQSGNSTC